MSSLSHCLKSMGLSEHEAAILRGAATDLVKDGYEAHAAAIQAIDDYLKTLEEERADLVKQIQTAKPEPKFSREAAPTFYSELARSVAKLGTNRAEPGMWKQAIANLKGVKRDEIEASGVTDWLDLQQGKVEKQAITVFLEQNGVKVEETVLGGATSDFTVTGQEEEGFYVNRVRNGDVGDEVAGPFKTEMEAERDIEIRTSDNEEGGPTKFSQYQLPGGQNYKELLLTLPDKTPHPDTVAAVAAADAKYYAAVRRAAALPDNNLEALAKAAQEQRVALRELDAARAKLDTPAGFRSSHFDQPNVLAHVRFNERTDATGARTLFIEELQSDWSARARREGFRDKEAQAANKRRLEPILAEMDALAKDRHPTTNQMLDEKKWHALANERDALYAAQSKQEHAPPSAPFVGKTEAWVALSLKRMIRYGSENGFDRVAWTNGEQQAERYDLSKHIEDIGYHTRGELYNVTVWGKGGKVLWQNQSASLREVEDTVGKEIAAKMQRGEGTKTSGSDLRYFTGLDLKVGGEGMKSFYDKIVPNVANDVLKRLGGGRVGEVKIGQRLITERHNHGWIVVGDESNQQEMGPYPSQAAAEAAIATHAVYKQPGFDITPQLRDNVMQGMPLFSRDTASSTLPSHEGPQTDQAEIDRLGQAIDRYYPSATTQSPKGSYFSAPLPVGISRLADAWSAPAYGYDTTQTAAGAPSGIFFRGKLYLHARGQRVHLKVFFHELTHKLEQDDPKLYAEYLKAVQAYILDYDHFHERMLKQGYAKGKNDQSARAETLSEFMAEITADGSMQETFWEALGRQSPELLRKVIHIARVLIDRAKAALGFQPTTMSRYFTDYEAVMRIAGTVMAKYGEREVKASSEPKFQREDRPGWTKMPGEGTRYEHSSGVYAVSVTDGKAEILTKQYDKTRRKFVWEHARRKPFVGDTQAAMQEAERRAEFLQKQGKKPDGLRAGYTAKANAIIDATRRVSNPLVDLPEERAYLKDRYLALGKIAAADRLAADIRKSLGEVTQADKKALYDYLTTADAKPDAIISPKVRDKARWIKDQINFVGDALVERGMLSPEDRAAYRDQYLPRLYLKHLLSDKEWAQFGGGKKPSDMGYLKQRKDIPAEVRSVMLGEIKDPSFLASVAIGKPVRDMALLDFLGQIAKNENWVLPQAMVDWQGKKVSAMWLKAEAGSLRKRARLYEDKGNAAKAETIANDMDKAADAALESVNESVLEDYRQIPDTARYGHLRGIWVRQEIHGDLMGVNDFLPTEPGAMQSLLGYGGVGTKVTQLWKLGKVALNPPSQIRNAVSNLVLLQLSGVPLHRIPTLLYRAAREIGQQGQFYKISEKYGVTESTYAAQELHRAKRDFLELAAKEEQYEAALGPLGKLGAVSKALLHARLIAEHVGEWAGDLYQLTEAWFKTAAIIDAMERQKMSEGDAALFAQDAMFDYSLIGKNLKYLRNAPIGSPFITFQGKVLPKLVEVMLKHPQRLLPWVGMFLTLPMIAMSGLDVDDEELKRMRRSLPEYLRNKGHAAFLPWRDELGRVQVVDLGYYFPWTMYTDFLQRMGRGEVTEAGLGAAKGLLSGPISDVLVALKTNEDAFTHQDIVRKGMTPYDQGVAVTNYLWNLMLPPIIGSQGVVSPIGLLDSEYGGKLSQGLLGTTTKYGEPRATVGQALGGAVGVNVKAVDLDISRLKEIKKLRHEVEETRLLLRSKLADRSLDAEDRKKIVDKYTEEIRERVEKLRTYDRESRLPEKVR